MTLKDTRGSFLRRINRYMELSNIDSVLKNELINNPENFNTFINEIVVNVSFRDPDFFKSLLTNVFPYLQSYPTINVWSAGCSLVKKHIHWPFY
jgi:chemotaxis protein methyltransferase CheR